MDLREEFLYHIWDEGHLKSDPVTVSGKPVRIVYPGQYNTNRGPDFFNAALTINGQNLTGSIEIHTGTYDWIVHHHDENPYYNKVILHVVFEHRGREPYTIREDGEPVEILELKDQLVEDINKLFDRHKSYPIKSHTSYCDLLSLIPNDYLGSILRKYGIQRFENKVKRFNTALLYSGFDQILYEGMMEAMGYDKNKYNFVTIAQTLNWEKLQEWYREGLGLDELIAIMTVSTGLLEISTNFLPSQMVNEIQHNFEAQPHSALKIPVQWQRFRIRPTNHPIYRMIGVCHFIHRALEKGLISALISIFADDKQDKDLFKRFKEWLRLSGSYKDVKVPRLGENNLKTMFINIILPIAYLYFQKIGKAKNADQVWFIYEGYPALADNYITSFMCKYLSKGQKQYAEKSAMNQQGLIELYFRYCQYHYCDECRQMFAQTEAKHQN